MRVCPRAWTPGRRANGGPVLLYGSSGRERGRLLKRNGARPLVPASLSRFSPLHSREGKRASSRVRLALSRSLAYGRPRPDCRHGRGPAALLLPCADCLANGKCRGPRFSARPPHSALRILRWASKLQPRTTNFKQSRYRGPGQGRFAGHETPSDSLETSHSRSPPPPPPVGGLGGGQGQLLAGRDETRLNFPSRPLPKGGPELPLHQSIPLAPDLPWRFVRRPNSTNHERGRGVQRERAMQCIHRQRASSRLLPPCAACPRPVRRCYCCISGPCSPPPPGPDLVQIPSPPPVPVHDPVRLWGLRLRIALPSSHRLQGPRCVYKGPPATPSITANFSFGIPFSKHLFDISLFSLFRTGSFHSLQATLCNISPLITTSRVFTPTTTTTQSS